MLKRCYYAFVYLASWPVFGLVAIVFNAGCAIVLLFPIHKRLELAACGAIRGLFRLWVAWLEKTGLVAFTWKGPPPRELPHPALYIANHPGLLDATFLLSYIPEAVCVFKPRLLRNPFLGPAARLAGYPAGDSGLELVHDVALKVARGRNLLLFPEGTRTARGTALNPLKPGFALIARRAGVPIQMVVLQANRDLLAKGRPWWALPRFPARVDIRMDRLIRHDPDRTTQDVVREVEARWEEILSAP